MQFDDRLTTVLRTRARSEAAARTQFRQLLDLLGSLPEGSEGGLVEAAYERLDALADEIPAAVQSRILRAPDLRLRNRALIARLAQGEPQAAAAAMATAKLSERDWLYLIPRLPLTARGFLRHRRDLPQSARQVLERLGVTDLVLPEPADLAVAPAEATEAGAPSPPAEPEAHGIGALVRRIEAFRQARREAPASSREPVPTADRLDFATDAQGTIVWADAPLAPMIVGTRLDAAGPATTAELDTASARALLRRLPFSGGRVVLAGAAAVAGEWWIDAAPAFDPWSGAFTGYCGRMRRIRGVPPAAPSAEDSPGDRMRQTLHELRTPVNAIQGFAEIIQQQLFGPAPNEYRALAAGIAVDAARLLAGFEELDRLASLESGAVELSEGSSDLREVVAQLLRRLDGVLRPRGARIVLAVAGSNFTVPLEQSEALRLVWRLLATLAGAMSPGEVLDLELAGQGAEVTLQSELPLALQEGELFGAATPAGSRVVSAGMFGSGFALRLARAEAAAAGGLLAVEDDRLALRLPLLTEPVPVHTVESRG